MTSVTGDRLVESRPIAYLEFKNSNLTRQHFLGRELSQEKLKLVGDRTESECVLTLTDRVNRSYETTFAIKDGGFLLYLKPPTERLGLFTIKVVACTPII